jgi:pyruvate ferredoxin oxidoreductase alpha subunit
MARRVGMEVSIAIAEAARLANVDIVSAYPITPQTHVVEHLSEFVADGELDAEFIPVESEHTAMSACVGSAAAGARTFTSTAAQGLALMHEILFLASSLRLPIVMAVANRALSGPISIWNDHSDIMSERDTGWIATFAENGQEALDFVLHAFRVAEDAKVQLPVMVNFDGFILSHVIEPIEIPDEEEVQRYLPGFRPARVLDVDRPSTMGPVGIPEIYTECKMAQDVALRESHATILKAWEEFGEVFGRRYAPFVTHGAEDADVLFIVAGGLAETVRTVVDELRREGRKVGLASLKLWRPFPFDEFRRLVEGPKVIAVVDRCISFGGPYGPMASEFKAALYGLETQPPIVEFVAGLGGRNVPHEDIRRMYEDAERVLAGAAVPEPRIVGLRE